MGLRLCFGGWCEVNSAAVVSKETANLSGDQGHTEGQTLNEGREGSHKGVLYASPSEFWQQVPQKRENVTLKVRKSLYFLIVTATNDADQKIQL